jgi:hypothetical protein
MSILFPISFLIRFGPGILNAPQCYFQPIRSTVQFPQERKRNLSFLNALIMHLSSHSLPDSIISSATLLSAHLFSTHHSLTFGAYHLRRAIPFRVGDARCRASSAQGTRFELFFLNHVPCSRTLAQALWHYSPLGYGNSEPTQPITF